MRRRGKGNAVDLVDIRWCELVQQHLYMIVRFSEGVGVSSCMQLQRIKLMCSWLSLQKTEYFGYLL